MEFKTKLNGKMWWFWEEYGEHVQNKLCEKNNKNNFSQESKLLVNYETYEWRKIFTSCTSDRVPIKNL